MDAQNGNGNTSSADQVTGNETKEWTETKCIFCKQDLRENSEPKLLPCLHSACKSCLLAESPNSSSPNSSSVPAVKPDLCPSCTQEIKHSDVIDHLFLLESLSLTAESVGKAEEAKTFSCTSCEDSASATGFCTECQEWLCEACIQAHQRVRVTKDHSIRPKDEMEGEKTSGLSQKYLFCPLHRQEQLKLYCESCDKVTCRDCQLLEHQDHKYQFLSKACEDEKLYLQTLLTKITEKQAYIEKARNTVNARHNEVKQKEEVLNQEIKMCAVRFITEINRRAKQLLHQLNEVCTQKKAQLSMKNEELVNLSVSLDHCLKFTEAAIKHGSEMALVYSKKAITNQLRHVLRRRCEVPHPQHVVDISFSYEASYLTQCISQLGCLFVDKQPVGALPPGAMQRAQAQHISSSQGASGSGATNQNSYSVQPSNQQASLSAATSGQRGSLQSDRQQQIQQHGLYGQPQVTSSTHPSNSTPPGHLLNLLQTTPAAQYNRTTVQSASPQTTTTITQSQSPSSFLNQTSTGYAQKQLPNNVRHPSQQSIRPPHYQPVSHSMVLPRNPNITISPVSLASNKQHPRIIRPQGQRMPAAATVTQTNSTLPMQTQVQKPPYPVLQRQLLPKPQVIVIDGDSATNKVLTMSNTPKLSHYPIPNSSSNSGTPVIGSAGANQVTAQTSNVPQSINVSSQIRPESSPHRPPSEGSNSLLPSTLSDVLDKNSVTITNVHIKPEVQLSSCAARSTKEAEKTVELSSKNAITTAADSSTSPARSSNNLDDSSRFSLGGSQHQSLSSVSVVDSNITSLQESTPIISNVIGNFVPTWDSSKPKENILSNEGTSKVDKNEGSFSSENTGNNALQSLEDMLAATDTNKELNSGSSLPDKTSQPANTSKEKVPSNADDPNEDWCAVCHDGGDLLCCGQCPRVFHLLCHVPVLNSTPSEDWVCRMCTDIDNASTTEESAGLKRKNALGLAGRELRICERILLDIMCHESSPPFHEPINMDEVPDYYEIIQKPMDMSTVRSKLAPTHCRHYRAVENFLADVRLIFKNCYQFNYKESELYQSAKVLEEYFDERLNKFLPEHAYDTTVGSQQPALNSLTVEESEEWRERKRQRKGQSDDEDTE